jgi:hypothetical protein
MHYTVGRPSGRNGRRVCGAVHFAALWLAAETADRPGGEVGVAVVLDPVVEGVVVVASVEELQRKGAALGAIARLPEAVVVEFGDDPAVPVERTKSGRNMNAPFPGARAERRRLARLR